MRSRLLVLASGEGTLLQHLIDACASGSVRAQIVAVGSDRHGTRAASRAEAAGIETYTVLICVSLRVAQACSSRHTMRL